MRRPASVLAAVVALAFAVYAVLGATIDAPRAFSDELLYVETATSLAEGDGLSIRGEPYEYGPLYPLAVAAVVSLSSDQEIAWAWMKLLNALFFSLAAVPVFLLARRLLRPWPSVAVAGLALAIPSGMYVSVVMTESLAYLAAAWAMYAIALALERPAWMRQVVALVAILVATGVRTQFAALLAAYLLGIAVVSVLVPGRLERPAALLRSYLPTALVLVAGIAAFAVVPIAQGSPPELLGNYGTLWRSYDPLEVLRWLVYHLANLELYLAVVPLAVAPIVLASLYRRARDGSEPHAAFLSLFVAVNGVFLLLVAAFNTTIWAGERLHDRPLFYVVPLWLIVLLVWIRDGMPRPLAAAAAGAAAAIVLPLALPVSDYVREEFGLQHNAAATAFWAEVGQAVGAVGLSALVALALVPLLLVLAALLVPARHGWVFPALVLGVFAVMAGTAWRSAERTASEWATTLPADERAWLDEHVPGDSSVTLLTAIGPCTPVESQRGPYLTEFFNRRVGSVVHLGERPDFLPSVEARVARDGTVTLVSGEPLRTDFAVAPEQLGAAGRRLAEGTTVPLVLTKVAGSIRLETDGWRAEVARRACD